MRLIRCFYDHVVSSLNILMWFECQIRAVNHLNFLLRITYANTLCCRIFGVVCVYSDNTHSLKHESQLRVGADVPIMALGTIKTYAVPWIQTFIHGIEGCHTEVNLTEAIWRNWWVKISVEFDEC